MGRTRSRRASTPKRAAAIALSLLAHVATKLKDEAAVNRGRRKAREEAALRGKRWIFSARCSRATLPLVALAHEVHPIRR